MNGLYSAAAGMAASQAWLDSLSNDVANVNTDGYKQERVAFRDLAYQDERGVAVGSGSATVDGGRSFRQGEITDTGEPLSLAIEGPGFFQVRRQNGQLALTRAGQFSLDANGSLVTANGDRLAPPITLPRGTDASSITIAADGTVSAAGTRVGRVGIVDVPAQSGLQSLGDNLFAATAQSGAPAAVPTARLRQGALESSNVDMASAMVDITQAQRGYQLQSKVIQTQDQLMEIANGIRH